MTRRILAPWLVAILMTATASVRAQVVVQDNGAVTLPWTEQFSIPTPEGDLSIVVRRPPPNATPVAALPVLYYTGTDLDALIIEAMDRVGSESRPVLLVGVHRGSAMGGLHEAPVAAAEVDRYVRRIIAARYSSDPARELYFSLSTDGRAFASLSVRPRTPFEGYLLADSGCPTNVAASAAAVLDHVGDADLLVVSSGDCEIAVGMDDPLITGTASPHRYHLVLDNRDRLTIIPEIIANAVTLRDAENMEHWRRNWISR